jgi:chemotaxis protein methyltransferase CheR
MLLNLFAFDVILCRNVMIYFSPPVVHNMIGHMRRCLVDGGWLLVGHAEHSLDLFREFRTVGFPGATAYQRMDGHDFDAPGRAILNPIPSPLQNPTPVPATNGRRPPTVIPLILPSSRKAALRRLPASSTRPESEPPAELAEVRALADAGHIEAAIARCEQLLKTHKMNPACHLHHALMLEQLGRHSLCEHALRRAIYVNRGFILAHYYLGVTLQRLHRGDEAAQSLRNVQQLLGAMDDRHVIGDSDGLTVAELSKLARMQLEAVLTGGRRSEVGETTRNSPLTTHHSPLTTHHT